MEIIFPVFFAFIGLYLLYWVIRMAVRDGIADARERHRGGGPRDD